MAKDPRFNFYPDNWSGGTKRMNFIQKGAYLELILLNFYCFSDGLAGFTEEEALKTLASATACAELWGFLKPKFQTDGAFYWSERMHKEFHKAKKSSDEQSKRALKRWKENPAYNSASLAVLPVNGYGSGNGSVFDSEEKGVQGEKFTDEWFDNIFNDELIGKLKDSFPHHNVLNEYAVFKLKVRGDPKHYNDHGTGGMWKAIIHQLKNSTATNGQRTTNQGTVIPTTAIIEQGKSFGKEKGFSRSGANGGGNRGGAKGST